MKKINDLEIKRNYLIDELNKNVDNTKDFTTEALTEVQRKKAEIDELAKQIEILRGVNSLSKFEVEALDKEETKVIRAFDFGQAVIDLSKGTIKGAAKEYHDEAIKRGAMSTGLIIPGIDKIKRANVQTDTVSDFITTSLSPDLSVIYSLKVLNDLGVKFIPNLTGRHDFPYMSQLQGGSADETSGATLYTITEGKDSLSPKAYTGYQIFTKEWMASTHPNIISSMYAAFQEDIGLQLQTAAIVKALSVAESFGTGLTLNAENIIALETNLLNTNLPSMAYVMPSALRGTLKNSFAGSGQTPIWYNGEVNGYKAIATNSCTANNVLYGSFDYLKIGLWGDQELLINPYTYDTARKVVVSINQLACAVVANPKAFIKMTVA